VSGVRDAASGAGDDGSDAAASGGGRRYELWTKADLLARAKQLGIDGRHQLNKKQLIAALRGA
jgi:hypothetical protein